MPPLWLISSTVVIIGFTLTVDRLVLKPRSHGVVVDGKTMVLRRKRDVTVLTAIEVALFAGVFATVLLMKGGVWLLVLVIPLAAFAGWGFWSGIRMGESPPPTEEDVKRGKRLMRKAMVPLAVLGVQVPFMIASRIFGGTLGMALTTVDIVLGLVVMWLFVLWFRAARQFRRSSPNSPSSV